MKKLMLLLAIVMSSASVLWAQFPDVAPNSASKAMNSLEGGFILSPGLSIISNFSFGSATFPPIVINGDFGMGEDFTLGGTIGLSRSEDYDINIYIIGARGNYYFTVGDKTDFYTGAMLGWAIVNSDYISVGGFAGNVYFGGRYKFNEKVGIYAELGYGTSILQLGASIKLK